MILSDKISIGVGNDFYRHFNIFHNIPYEILKKTKNVASLEKLF